MFNCNKLNCCYYIHYFLSGGCIESSLKAFCHNDNSIFTHDCVFFFGSKSCFWVTDMPSICTHTSIMLNSGIYSVFYTKIDHHCRNIQNSFHYWSYSVQDRARITFADKLAYVAHDNNKIFCKYKSRHNFERNLQQTLQNRFKFNLRVWTW